MASNLEQQARGTLATGYAAGSIPARVEFDDRRGKSSSADLLWLCIFLVGFVAHLSMGFYMVAKQNVYVEDGVVHMSDALQQDIAACQAAQFGSGFPGGAGRLLDEFSGHRQLASADNCKDLWCVFNLSAYIPVVTILLVPVLGLLWMMAMHGFPRVVVWGSVLVGGTLYSLFGIMLVSEGATEAGAVFIVLAGVSFGFLFATRGAVDKTAEHVRAAMTALYHNKDIFAAAFVLEAVMLAFLGLNWWFLIKGSQVLAVDDISCIPEVGTGIQEMWGFQFFYLFWFVSFCDMGKMVVTAMTVGAWFFETPPQSSSMRPAFLGLKATFTTSAGAVAAGSLIAGLFDYILEKTSTRFWWLDPGLIVLKCFVALLQSCIQAFTRFAMVAHAFTGEGFFASATRMYAIMKRSFISAYVTDRVATTVIAVGSQSAAIALGTLTWYWIDQDNGWSTLKDLTGEDSVFGGLAGFFAFILIFLYIVRRPMLGLLLIGFLAGGATVSWPDARIFSPFGGAFVACVAAIILQFQGSVMLNTIDTMFICYALGKENNELNKPLTGGRELVYAMMVDIPEAQTTTAAQQT